MSLFSRIFRRKGQSKRLADEETVTFDDVAVVRTMRDGTEERLLWSDLCEVSIVTTEEGPFADDVFWLLVGTTGGCAVPSNAVGAAALLERLQELPGFDNETVIKAMGSTGNAEFVCWQRDDGPT
jgi:hypothetical protein